MSSIEDAFRNRGVTRGGTLLLKADDAIKLVQAAKQAGLPVLGLDAFVLTDTVTQPLLEKSTDYSDQPGAYDLAEQHLRRHAEEGLHFEVVVGE